MKRARIRTAVIFLLSAVLASGTQSSWAQTSTAWKSLKPLAPLAPTNQLRLAIGLPLRNRPALDQFLRELFDPASPDFRHYLTPEEFTERFGPTEADYQSVIAFARSRGLSVRGTHPNRMLLDVAGSAAEVEKAFHVSLEVYQHPKEARTFFAPDREPAVNLAVPILGVEGLNNYSRPRPLAQTVALEEEASHPLAGTGSGRGGSFRGKDFRTAYAPGTPLTGAGQKVGLLEFDGYDVNDITNYEFSAKLTKVPLSNVLLDGFKGRPSGTGGEVEVCLDIETAIAMAPGMAGVIVYMGSQDTPFTDLLNRMATDNLAKQLACCWYNPNLGVSEVTDQIFQQMAAQGQSFFSASGDNDAFSGAVSFPFDNPYITLVGGTSLTTASGGGAYVSEKVWNEGGGEGSGGGISPHYAIPDYQTNISMALNGGSTSMRNMPDVAIVGQNVYVRANGRDYLVRGTSCGAPLWAGFAALINQKATVYGSPIGFINPLLTRIGSLGGYGNCFHDIVAGDNSGYSAVPGYDLCTGWGSPTGQRLIDALATPDPLLISPGGRLILAGGVGGPFKPAPGTLMLTNAGTGTMSWTLVNTSAWFDVSPVQGTFSGRARSTKVTVSANATATNLPAGIYTAYLVFTNLNTGVSQSRLLTLGVGAPGIADDFEPNIDITQWADFGGTPGIDFMAAKYGGSASGSNALWFGGAGHRSATTIPINASAGGEIGFCIRLANGSGPRWSQADDPAANGVVLEYSNNAGESWTILGNYNGAAWYDWTSVISPIPVAAKTGASQFRWRQLGDSGTNAGNWALDRVAIRSGSYAPQVIIPPLSQAALAGSSATLSVAALGSRPLSYQWCRNGANISGATSSSLVIANVQPTNAGNYTVSLRNNVGTLLSSNALLIVSPPPSGLVSWWRAEGNGRDQQGLNHGTLTNGTGFAKSRIGQAFTFNGNNQCVVIPYSKTLVTSNFSIGAWVKPMVQINGDVLEDVIFAQNGGWHLFTRAGSFGVIIEFGFATSGGQNYNVLSTSEIPVGEFSQVTGTWDGTTLRLYVNGVLAGQSTPGVFPGDPGSGFYVGGFYVKDGRRLVYVSQFFVGLIDEVLYFGRALTGVEAQSLYNVGPHGPPLPPIIEKQPQSLTFATGTNLSLSILVDGAPPLSYQWHFDGADISGATESVLAITNTQLADSGTYDVTVTNYYGSNRSAGATLTLLIPPQITSQPSDQTGIAGSDVTFSVSVTGDNPLSYQWYFQGEPLAGASGPSLILTGLSLTNEGVYQVRVNNPVGSVLSRGALLIFADRPSCMPAPPGLVSWWKGDGTALDSSGTNHGTMVNGAGFAQGEVGSAFSFNGSNQCAIIPYSTTLVASNFSLELWVEPAGKINNQLLIFGQPYAMQLVAQPVGPGSDVYLRFYLTAGASVATTSAIPIGAFSHIVITSDGTALRLYQNGTLQAQAGAVGSPANSGLDFNIGGFYIRSGGQVTYAGQFFNGLIDEISYYGRVLTSGEVQALYINGSAGKCRSVPPSLRVENLTDGLVRVVCQGTAGRSYQFQAASSLLKTGWVDLGTVTADQSGVCEYIDRPPGTAPLRFYRAIPR